MIVTSCRVFSPAPALLSRTSAMSEEMLASSSLLTKLSEFFLLGLDLDQSAAGFGGESSFSALSDFSVHCWWIWWRMNLFQDWISRGTFVFAIEEASENIRPSAEVSGIVLRALRKFAGWQGIPWPESNMWNR